MTTDKLFNADDIRRARRGGEASFRWAKLSVDAIARLFPDGFPLDKRYCLDIIAEDIADAVVEGDAHVAPLLAIISGLQANGRLRHLLGNVALSHAEQASRVIDTLGAKNNPSRALLEQAVANVLAGKTEKRA